MQDFEPMAEQEEESSKHGRYAVPKCLADCGVKILKSDTPLLPRHSAKADTKTAQEEREDAVDRVQERKRRVKLEFPDQEDGSGATLPPPKSYLKPTPLKQSGGNDFRDKMAQSFATYMDTQSRVSLAEATNLEMEKKTHQLECYMKMLTGNPDLDSGFTQIIKELQGDIIGLQAEMCSECS